MFPDAEEIIQALNSVKVVKTEMENGAEWTFEVE